MGTLGPTGTKADCTSFANFASWAGTGTFGINTALTNFGWTRTSDPNQVNWAASPSAPPPSGSTYPLSLQAGASYNGGVGTTHYTVNCRGTWVSGATYNLWDVVTSPITGASYILARSFIVNNGASTAVSVSGVFATLTASNNLVTTGGDKVKFYVTTDQSFLLQQTWTVVSANSTSFVIDVHEAIGSANNFSSAESAQCGIVLTSTVDPSVDTTNWSVYHYEIWQSNDAQSFPVTNVARTAGGLATFTCSNRFKAGFNVVVAGLTNVPQLNGTWCVAAATTTTFTVQTGGGLINSTADSGTATYTFLPMLMKFEYYGNTQQYSTEPWVRVSFGIGGTDGAGNLTGNYVGSNVAQFSLAEDFIFCDLRPSGVTDTGGAQTSSIWQCAAEGASPTGTNTVGNAGRFGVSLFYSRNDTFATNRGSIFWLVERAYSDGGYASDDYMTYLVGCLGNAGVFASNLVEVQQRSIMKPNPLVAPISVSVVSNTVAVSYAPPYSYQFAVGAFVFASNFFNAKFLNDQFLQVTAASLSLTSVATTTTTVDSLSAAAAQQNGQTAYTGTFSPTISPGTSVTVSGFTNLPNNGTFTVATCTATTLVVNNQFGVKETASASATYSQAVYTGTVTNGASSFYAGLKIAVVGFTGANNNGTFTCTASSATTLTLSNAAATAETHAATATGNFLIASFTNANYGPTPDSGNMSLSTSNATPTPIAGTGLVCLSDPRANCPYTSQSTLIVNNNTPLLPVFPVLGFIGNPMTIGGSVKNGDLVTHDQTFPVTVYGVSMHYYNLQGSTTTDPYAAFGGQNGNGVSGATGSQNNQRTNSLLLRWD